ncbi:MAG: hypothetical protein WBG76_03720 [Ornithinimicrobium sp.]
MLSEEITHTVRQIAGALAVSTFIGGCIVMLLFVVSNPPTAGEMTPAELGRWWAALPGNRPSGDWTAVLVGMLVLLLAIHGYGAFGGRPELEGEGAPVSLVAKAIVRDYIEAIGWIFAASLTLAATVYVERDLDSVPTYAFLIAGASTASALGVLSESRISQWRWAMRREVSLRHLGGWVPPVGPPKLAAYKPLVLKASVAGLALAGSAAGPAILEEPISWTTTRLVVSGYLLVAISLICVAYLQVLGQVSRASRQGCRSVKELTSIRNRWSSLFEAAFAGLFLTLLSLVILLASGLKEPLWLLTVALWAALPAIWAWMGRRYGWWHLLAQREGVLRVKQLLRSQDFQRLHSRHVVVVHHGGK